ncbi:hypothetical protein [Tumebacillus permanentifrigoris]|uniref:YceG-like family protein n=1 Tax=Tumebacillus permanentifrigoris TaxID=378543 RepID=A0A316DVK6_9BACL|nr:hypothetical protein [Tumebacillus permanentifrigoris]PWK13375.1 hypothetical protein C7459_10741 [Tumebacillus permanentifrigoris]
MTTTIDLLKDTVGKPLKQALQDLGCPALPIGLFSEKQIAFLRESITELPADDLELERLILGAATTGKVIRSGQTPLGQSLFTVRFRVKKVACVMTWAYSHDEWTLHHVDAVQTRVREWNRLIFGGLVGSVLTALVTFLVWGTGSGDLVAEAKAKGYVVMTEQQYEEQVQSNVSDSTQQPTQLDKSAGGQQSSRSDKAATLSFTLQDGAPLDDLTSYLQDIGLIQDKAAFNQVLTTRGVDTLIKPQTYTFTKGMSLEEILSVLQN